MEGLCEVQAANTDSESEEDPQENEDESSVDSSNARRAALRVEKSLLSLYEHELEVDRPRRQSQLHTERPPETTASDSILHKRHAYPCDDTHRTLPKPPSSWPQRPIMLRPTPHTKTLIRGMRSASSTEYQNFSGFCSGCILPVNTGREQPGKSFVIDFESNHFVGTALFRIQEAPPVPSAKDDLMKTSYFDGKKRTFQVIVKGKFKTPLKMSECVTGQWFRRPAGPLPSKWIVTSFIKLVSVLSPQLEASVEAEEPRFLSPLVSTAQTVMSKPHTKQETKDGEQSTLMGSISNEEKQRLYNYSLYKGSHDMEDKIEEPLATDPTSLMPLVFSSLATQQSVTKRQKTRKKAYNQVYAQRADEPRFDVDKEYTFEFYQHLLLYGDRLALDMGRAIGKVDLAPILDGQPIQVMAAHKDTKTGELDLLWSFDIWHESLYDLARAAE